MFIMRLVLFDIDGTLLVEDQRANERFIAAIQQVFGRRVDMSKYVSSGKTDTAILLDLCEIANIPESEAKAELKRLYEASIAYVREHIAAQPTIVQKGVVELLNMLSRRTDCLLGLVTGNLRECARLRLGDLYRFFKVGGFGETSATRSKLVDTAIREATSLTHGEFYVAEDVFYFGDTPLDIQAGKEAGVTTVGVATGRYSREELEKATADFALTDLSNTQQILKMLRLT
jgi:phosphoglycolate phosphatase-like HAD superfamily hydrolase